jgi:hypothetical protein
MHYAFQLIKILYRFSQLLPFGSAHELSHLSEEFLLYQLLDEQDIPQCVWDEAKVTEHDEDGREGDEYHYVWTVCPVLPALAKLPN